MQWNPSYECNGAIFFYGRPNNQNFNGANVKLHNGGTLGLGQASRNMSGISSSSLQPCCDGLFFGIFLFMFSAIKGPAKKLRLEFNLMNYRLK